MEWWRRLPDADRRSIAKIADDERTDTGDGWQLVTVCAVVFGLGSVIFFVTGDWAPGIPALLGTVFLGNVGLRKYRLCHPRT